MIADVFAEYAYTKTERLRRQKVKADMLAGPGPSCNNPDRSDMSTEPEASPNEGDKAEGEDEASSEAETEPAPLRRVFEDCRKGENCKRIKSEGQHTFHTDTIIIAVAGITRRNLEDHSRLVTCGMYFGPDNDLNRGYVCGEGPAEGTTPSTRFTKAFPHQKSEMDAAAWALHEVHRLLDKEHLRENVTEDSASDMAANIPPYKYHNVVVKTDSACVAHVLHNRPVMTHKDERVTVQGWLVQSESVLDKLDRTRWALECRGVWVKPWLVMSENNKEARKMALEHWADESEEEDGEKAAKAAGDSASADALDRALESL